MKELKSRISKSGFTVAKIQDTTIVEQELLQQAMDYIAIDRVGDYHGRMNELNKYRYMIDGILYNHLDSKQINFSVFETACVKHPFAKDVRQNAELHHPEWKSIRHS